MIASRRDGKPAGYTSGDTTPCRMTLVTLHEGVSPATQRRAFAVKVAAKRLPVFPFSGLLKGCKGHETHRFENGGTNQIRKTGKREVVFLQPLPQTLYAAPGAEARPRTVSLNKF